MEHHSTDIVVLSDEEVETTIPERLKFPCRCIRLGSFETYPKAGKSCIPVILNKNGIFFVVPIISPIKDLYFIKLNTSDVVHIDCHFENRFAKCMFVHTTVEWADALRQQLDEFVLDPLQYDSEDKNLRVVIFVLQEKTSLEIQNLQQYLRHVFSDKGVINEKVTWEQVNDMLTNSTVHQRDEQAENGINVAVNDIESALRAANISSKPSMLQLSCSYILAGFVKILPSDRSPCVTLRATFDSFSFTVSERRNVSIRVKYKDITNLAYHFDEELPIICFRTTTECAKCIRFQLYTINGSDMRNATESELEMQHRIIFLLKDLTEEQKRFLRMVFCKCSIPAKQIHGIKSARDVLVKFSQKPTQKELQNFKKLMQRPSILESSLSSESSDICVIEDTEIGHSSMNSTNVTVVDLDVEDTADDEKNASCIMNDAEDNTADIIVLETSLIKNTSSNIDVSTNSVEETDAYIDIEGDDDDISVIGTTHTKCVECIVDVPESNVQKIGIDNGNSAKKTKSHAEENMIDWKIPNNAKTSLNDIIPEAVIKSITEETSKKQYSLSAVKPKLNNKAKNKNGEQDINNSNYRTYARYSLTSNKIVNTNNIANNGDASITSKRNEAELKIPSENKAEIPCKVKTLKNNVECTKILRSSMHNKIDVVELQRTNTGKENEDVLTTKYENNLQCTYNNVKTDDVDVANFGSDEKTISETDGIAATCFSNIADHVKMRVRICRGKTTRMSDKNYALKSEGEWDKNFEKSVARFPFLYSEILFQKSIRDPLFSKIVYRARKKTEPSLYFECWKGDYKEADSKDLLNRPGPMRNPYKKRRKTWAFGVAKPRSRKREIKPPAPSLPLVETMNVDSALPLSTAMNGYISPQSTPSNAQKVRRNNSKRKLASQEVASTVSVIKPKKLSFTDPPSRNSTKRKKISNATDSVSPPAKNVAPVEKGPSFKIRLKKCKNGFKSSIFSSNSAVNKKARGEEHSVNTIVKKNKDTVHKKSPTNKSVTIRQKCDKKAKSPARKQSKPDNSVPKPRKKRKTNDEKTVSTNQHSKSISIEQASGKHKKESSSKKQTLKVPSKKSKVPKKKGN